MGDDAQVGGSLGDRGPGHGDHGRFVVVMADPVTGEIDAFGPYVAVIAHTEVERRRRELAAEGLGEVVVVAVALTPPG